MNTGKENIYLINQSRKNKQESVINLVSLLLTPLVQKPPHQQSDKSDREKIFAK